MLRHAAFVALAFLAGPALAQQPPAYQPIELTADEVKALDEWLGNQPYKIVSPLANFLGQKQKAAADAAAKAKEQAKEPTK